MSSLKIPNMLAYSRSINPTDALMFGVNSETGAEAPVEVAERGTRAPFSNYSEAKNAEKDRARGNPKFGETAFLSPESDTLRLKFSVVFTGNSRQPYSCTSERADVRDALNQLTAAFSEKGGYEVLAKRYVDQILNGSVAWRNTELSDEITVKVSTRKGSLTATNSVDGMDLSSDSEYQALVSLVAQALSQPKGFARLTVVVDLPMASMTEVFPSQVFKDGEKKKLLAGIRNGDIKQGIVYNQKIGNAIRRIDDWYEDGAEYALAVEPFGIDRSIDKAVRIDSGRHFYNLLTKNLLGFVESTTKAANADEIEGDVFYFVACLIRGGVFSGKE